jgi:hypothetical protein
MKLVDMKRTKAEKTARENECKVPLGGDDYPYGLNLHLDNDQLKKLGIDTLPKAGDTLTLQAKCKVISSSQRERDGGKPERTLEIQLQKVALTKGAGSMVEALSDAIDS